MAKRRGWKWDGANSRLVLYADGTEVARFEDGKLAFHGSTAADAADAYTQTYSTTARTVPAATQATPPAGGTGATVGAYDTAENRDLMIASITAGAADLLALKKVVNALIDDLQEIGLIG